MIRADKTFTLDKHQKDVAQKQAEELARLDKIVENSSEKNRNFFIAYLGLLIYVQAIIFSTTDLQLLVSTGGLKLPLIDLNVPLVGFYVVVPIFIIALHFNFLQNLESHHYKLMRWQELHPGGIVPRQYIYPFLFDFAILQRNSKFHRLIKITNSLLSYNLAPITLGLLLIRFSDRQEWLTTLWHYFAFLFDCGLARKFHRSLQDNQEVDSEEQSKSNMLLGSIRFIFGGLSYGISRLFGLLVLIETLLAIAIGGTSDEFFVRNVQPWTQPITKIGFVGSKSDEAFGNKSLFLIKNNWAQILNQAISNPVEWFIPRIVINPNEKAWEPDVPAIEKAAKLAGYNDWPKYFNEYGVGFRPGLRSLRFLNLFGQRLPRAFLIQHKLQGAIFNASNLEGASLNQSQLIGAEFIFAQLQNADLSYAQLQDADLDGALLHSANLSNAQLQGAYLGWAGLQGINLKSAQLQGAHLSFSSLQGANLSNAQFQGAEMDRVKLEGAFLGGTQLQGTELQAASLEGVILGEGYDMRKSNIQGAMNIPWASVFSNSPEELLAKERVDWDKIKSLSERIVSSENKEYFLRRIHQAENNARKNDYHTKLQYRPRELALKALNKICSDLGSDFELKARVERNNRLAAQAFRKQYSELLKSYYENNDLKYVVTDIDRKLCTLPECADIKDDFEGLDCKPFSQESALATKAKTK